MLDILVVFEAILGETKVTDLDNTLFSEKDISCSQISVDQFLGGEILHSSRDLETVADEVACLDALFFALGDLKISVSDRKIFIIMIDGDAVSV